MNDLIKREDAIKAIEDLPNAYNGWSDAYDKAYIIGTLEEVPSAEPKQGEWIIHGESPLYVKECSACGAKFFHHAFEDPTPYCAECGARMLVAVAEEFKRFLEE